jgi:hypothetical protein
MMLGVAEIIELKIGGEAGVAECQRQVNTSNTVEVWVD